MRWPDDEALKTLLPLPEGVRLRWWKAPERLALPGWLARWYPTVLAGSESCWLDATFLEHQVARPGHEDRDAFALAICQGDAPIGFQGFVRERRSRTLHARLGVLAPEARTSFLGALGFPMFEHLGRVMGAELLSVWVTLASKGQQLAAERAGFELCGLVPGFDVDRQADGSELRVMEALYVKLLAREQLLWPDDAQLTAKTRALRRALSFSE